MNISICSGESGKMAIIKIPSEELDHFKAILTNQREVLERGYWSNTLSIDEGNQLTMLIELLKKIN